MSKDSYTCEICGEEKMDETAIQTHMYFAHVCNEVACMFCDLRGVTAEEMTLHINSVHCSDDHRPDVDQSGWQQHLNNNLRQNTENRSTNKSQAMHLPLSSDMSVDLTNCDSENVETGLRDACKVPFHSNCNASQQVMGHESPGIVCERSSKQQKLTLPVASSCSEKADLLPVYVNAYSGTKERTNHPTSISQCSVSMPHRLPRTADADCVDKALHGSSENSDAAQSRVSLHENGDLNLLLHVCPMCDQLFENTDILQLHVNTHFDEPQAAGGTAINNISAANSEQKSSTNSARQRKTEKLIDASLIDDNSTCTVGIVEKIQRIPYGGNHPIQLRYVCSPLKHFISQGYNCGFRNLQMLLSCLMKDAAYLRRVFSGRPLMPSVYRLQQLIENAWSAGFDETGCRQLGGQLVGTRRWIGATEIYAVLSFLGARCEIVDFHKPTGDNNTHPRLMQWVKDYFQKGQGKFLPPLYFQHQGHSRTIVGVEEVSDGSLILLIFDPGCRQMKKFQTSTDVASLMHLVRRDVSTLTSRQYQILSVHGIISDEQAFRSKVVTSTRIP